MPSSEKKNSRSFAFTVFCLVLIVIELISFFGVKALRMKQAELFYEPKIVSRAEYEAYLAARDTLLGWPTPKRIGNGYFDATGSRMIPAFPDPKKDTTLISLYGDSMTESLEVDSAAAWSNQLSMMVKGRVANFGKAAFGTDQALLYFIRNTNDHAKIVFFNHMSENILRNVNQFRYLLSPAAGHELGFKPRYLAENNALKLIPLPTLSYEQYAACCVTPKNFLRYEYFIPDNGISGIQTQRFPYALTLARLVNNYIMKPKIQQVPRHIRFYERDHPSNALNVTGLIMKRFFEEAMLRNTIPVVTIIPDGKDIEHYINHQQWSYQTLIDDLNKDGIEVLNFGPGILQKLNGRNPCDIINDCYNHFNAEGYRIVAEIAYEYLKEKNLLRKIGR